MPPLTICPQTHSTRSIHNLGDDDVDDDGEDGDDEDGLKYTQLGQYTILVMTMVMAKIVMMVMMKIVMAMMRMPSNTPQFSQYTILVTTLLTMMVKMVMVMMMMPRLDLLFGQIEKKTNIFFDINICLMEKE